MQRIRVYVHGRWRTAVVEGGVHAHGVGRGWRGAVGWLQVGVNAIRRPSIGINLLMLLTVQDRSSRVLGTEVIVDLVLVQVPVQTPHVVGVSKSRAHECLW